MHRLLLSAALAAAAWSTGIAASAAPTPSPASTASPSPPAPSPSSTPAPPASTGVLSLQPSLGPPGTTITVQGAAFRKGEPVTLYWDSPSTSFGQVTADDAGAFKLDVKAPAGDPGQHVICPLQPGPQQGCGQFKLEAAAAPTPTPSATAAPTPAPAPSAAPPSPAELPATDRPAAVAALLRPPFVIFPALVLLALIGGCAYWIWAGRRRRPQAPAATVVHRSLRPPAPPSPAPSPPPSPASSPPPPADLPAPRAAPDGSLDLPQPGD